MSNCGPEQPYGARTDQPLRSRQTCFIAYSERAPWKDDLLEACKTVFNESQLDLELDSADKRYDPAVPLHQKVLNLIKHARYGLYDLSYWPDQAGTWQMPRNVLIELGMALVFNQSLLLLRTGQNREAGIRLPSALDGFNAALLEFTGTSTLKRELRKVLPSWLNRPAQQDWYSSFCSFGERKCEYRDIHPYTQRWSQDALQLHIGDGPDTDQADFRAVVEDVLNSYDDLSFAYLDAQPSVDGYPIRLCSVCQTVRSHPLAIYRLTPTTSADTYIAIGMSLALEHIWGYSIRRILLAEHTSHVPSLLAGYEIILVQNDQARKRRLLQHLPTLLRELRASYWQPTPLPLIDLSATMPDQPTTELVTQIPINQWLRALLADLQKLPSYQSVEFVLALRAPDDTTVIGDPQQLRIVLTVVVDNAVAAMEGNLARQVKISSMWDASTNMVEIEISDTDPSSSDVLHKQLFRQPLPRLTGGEGLGAALLDAAALVSEIGGELAVAHTGAASSTMRLRLRGQSQAQSSAAATAAAPTLLCVDNNSDFLATWTAFFEEKFRVLAATGPAEALRLVRTEQIDLAIIDDRLLDDSDINDTSGIQLGRQPAFRTIPKILFAGAPTVEMVREAFSRQADERTLFVNIITKHEGLKELLRAVEATLEKYRNMHNAPIPTTEPTPPPDSTADPSQPATVLYVDNDVEFLERGTNMLQLQYRVIPALSPEEALRIVRAERIDLAILGVRLIDDDDPNDVSGLALARRPEFRAVPKIIHMSRPPAEIVQEFLLSSGESAPTEFIGKAEGSEQLVNGIERLLAARRSR